MYQVGGTARPRPPTHARCVFCFNAVPVLTRASISGTQLERPYTSVLMGDPSPVFGHALIFNEAIATKIFAEKGCNCLADWSCSTGQSLGSSPSGRNWTVGVGCSCSFGAAQILLEPLCTLTDVCTRQYTVACSLYESILSAPIEAMLPQAAAGARRVDELEADKSEVMVCRCMHAMPCVPQRFCGCTVQTAADEESVHESDPSETARQVPPSRGCVRVANMALPRVA